MKINSILLGLGLATASAIAAPADTWTFAVTDVQGMERLQVEWGPFKTALEAATGDTFEFFPVNSRTAAAEALRGETVDFVISGPAEYVVINQARMPEGPLARATRSAASVAARIEPPVGCGERAARQKPTEAET